MKKSELKQQVQHLETMNELLLAQVRSLKARVTELSIHKLASDIMDTEEEVYAECALQKAYTSPIDLNKVAQSL